jgi:cytochrome c-type biogenesis protein CcmH
MMLLFLMALMTLGAIFAVLWPWVRRAPMAPSGSDVAVYRDQLEEIERDRLAGLIGGPEAEAARVEVSRRLLAAADAGDERPSQLSDRHRGAIAVVAIMLLPVGATSLYLALGSPTLPGTPLAERIAAQAQNPPIGSLIAEIETYLESNPKDGRGWEVVAPVYLRLGRFGDAVKARNNALNLLGPDAERESYLGEALMAAANGTVTADAKQAFERALKLDPKNVAARYYFGLAAEQNGQREEAGKIWQDLINEAPPGAPWLDFMRNALARLEGKPPVTGPGPGGGDMQASANPPPEHQGDQVLGMVQRLADRLKQDGSDVEGWIKLVRSYRVLGENERAQAALAEARQALAADATKLSRLNQDIAALGMEDVPGAKAAGETVAEVQAGVTSGPDQQPDSQSEMIRGMVDRLADRLKQDGSDFEGWVRLVRAYIVLGEQDKARAAVSDARRAMGDDAEKRQRLDDLVKDLGIQG